ncbi:citrate lyase subunit alpha [Chishuiella sp.]|uniref:citrate lyase subunit alpha n=1 Tax=Chishuiella sp. TaxID=1969467 RepID=UPI0028AAB861|nr:citrate lyase subunit alpha [Chishuiella sp.]
MNQKERVSAYLEQQKDSSAEAYKKVFKLDLLETIPHDRKICRTISEVIDKSGLKDGMTISFHHAFRNGDYVINMVMKEIVNKGFKNLILAASSLNSCNYPLIQYIKDGVIRKIYTSGLRGDLAMEISSGIMKEPVNIHTHGGRVHLIKEGELNIDIAFLGVPYCDEFGNATGVGFCGSLGYAKTDAQYAKKVVLITENIEEYPFSPKSIAQDEVDYIVKVDKIGDPAKIGADATRMTKNPRELLIAKKASEVIIKSGFFKDGFSLQTGSGGAALAVTQFLENKMRSENIKASFALGGITSSMVKLHEEGLILKLLDVQSFDKDAARSIKVNPNHIEISANQYANYSSKGASVERLDVVVLSALEIDTNFNVNVLTGSDGVIRGASGGHSDAASTARMAIIVAPLVRGRIPTVVENVLTCVTPGENIDVLVTDHGIAVNPQRPNLKRRLEEAGIPTITIEELKNKAIQLTGKPKPIEFTDKPVAVVRYRNGSIIDTVYQIKS